MHKKRLLILLAIVLAASFCFAGCQKDLPVVEQKFEIENYERQELIMNAGDTYSFDVKQFKSLGVDYVKYELVSSDENVIRIKKDILTAVDNGFAKIFINLYTKGSNSYNEKGYIVTNVRCANVFVINESTMTEITTAQELVDIRDNLGGNYILKANIDLAGIDWQPLGASFPAGYPGQYDPSTNAFTGMFVNPYGFAISNLTITSSEKIYNTVTTVNAGLFGFLYCAFIDGIILENVFIDIMDADSKLLPTAGGITGEAWDSFIANCKVEGEFYTSYQSGGISGYDQNGIYKNCEFNGIVKAESIDSSYLSQEIGAGGIVGYYVGYIRINNFSYFANEGIFACKVNAEIASTGCAGGIVGFNHGNSKPTNCTFIGTTCGEKGQGDMYGYSRW